MEFDMTLLVFGGSSQIGHFLLPRLGACGESIIALSRTAQPSGRGVEWLSGRLPDQVPPLPSLSGIICLGPLQALADWLGQVSLRGAPRVIAISSMSAESKRNSSIAAERAISHQLRSAEAALAAACERQGCAWTLLRPTLVYGAGLDKSLSPIAGRARRWRVFGLPAGSGLRQPVHADDLAQAVLIALERSASAGRILSIGGGERITSAEMFARVRASLGIVTLPIPVPAWMQQIAQQLLPSLRGPLSRLNTDLIADNDEMQRLLGIAPRPFHLDSSMWLPPTE
jgi:nucleoside-diphosphate-sugar epimerase